MKAWDAIHYQPSIPYPNPNSEGGGYGVEEVGKVVPNFRRNLASEIVIVMLSQGMDARVF
jgi:hypothetical protein